VLHPSAGPTTPRNGLKVVGLFDAIILLSGCISFAMRAQLAAIHPGGAHAAVCVPRVRSAAAEENGRWPARLHFVDGAGLLQSAAVLQEATSGAWHVVQERILGTQGPGVAVAEGPSERELALTQLSGESTEGPPMSGPACVAWLPRSAPGITAALVLRGAGGSDGGPTTWEAIAQHSTGAAEWRRWAPLRVVRVGKGQ
jgi:hypothetical protein